MSCRDYTFLWQGHKQTLELRQLEHLQEGEGLREISDDYQRSSHSKYVPLLQYRLESHDFQRTCNHLHLQKLVQVMCILRSQLHFSVQPI